MSFAIRAPAVFAGQFSTAPSGLIPSYAQEHDLLYALVRLQNTTGSVTIPSGWTSISDLRTSAASNNARLLTCYRAASAAEPTSYQWAVVGGLAFATVAIIPCFETGGGVANYGGYSSNTGPDGLTHTAPLATGQGLALTVWGQYGGAGVTLDVPFIGQTVYANTNAQTGLAVIALPGPGAVLATCSSTVSNPWVAQTLYVGGLAAEPLMLRGSVQARAVASVVGVAVPSNVVSGDCLVALAYADTGGGPDLPPGWNHLAMVGSVYRLMTRTAASEPVSYTFATLSGGAAVMKVELAAVFDTLGNGVAVDVYALNGPSSGVSAWGTPTVSPTASNELVLCGWVHTNATDTHDTPNGPLDAWIGRQYRQTGTAWDGTWGGRVTWFSESAASVTVARTATAPSTPTWYAAQVAIKAEHPSARLTQMTLEVLRVQAVSMTGSVFLAVSGVTVVNALGLSPLTVSAWWSVSGGVSAIAYGWDFELPVASATGSAVTRVYSAGSGELATSRLSSVVSDAVASSLSAHDLAHVRRVQTPNYFDGNFQPESQYRRRLWPT